MVSLETVRCSEQSVEISINCEKGKFDWVINESVEKIGEEVPVCP